MPRKPRYKRNPRLTDAFRRHQKNLGGLAERWHAWMDVLSQPLTETDKAYIATHLAQSGLSPAEGAPHGYTFDPPKCDVLVYLDGVTGTLEERAEALQIASLMWSRYEGEQGICTSEFVEALARGILAWCDLEGYWHRPSVGLDKAGVIARYEADHDLCNARMLADQLRRVKNRR